MSSCADYLNIGTVKTPEIASQEEGYSSFKEWFKNSQTLNAKFFRFNLKFALPGLMILSILSGVIIGILK